MWARVAIADTFTYHDGAKSVLYRVYRAGTDTTAGGAAGQQQGIDAERHQHRSQ
ncbi:hypothetical protein D3C80_1700590 [compost metagenome]